MRYGLYAGVAFIVACGGNGDAAGPGNVLIYADRGGRQCESDGISPEESAQTLIGAGIDVLRSTCGIRTGVAFAAVCGGETGQIVVHEIRSISLPTTERLGFQLISTLIDSAASTSYQLVDCEN